ncbi:HEPN domain-containing protein [Nafulsella turpanensis]|uniref:HEPN domain-containing protein n=1 Tax=Nafulsella turpanensis TaxID=1265690 RepID=UPI000345CA94|nr:HEPN domain-containing protein [Nafulsella turpanensis]
MYTSTYHLPAALQQKLRQALQLMQAQTQAEKILLLSLPSSLKDTSESPQPYLDRLNFLILLPDAQNQQRKELQEKLEESCRRAGIPINALVHTTAQFRQMRQLNPYLFPELQKEGILLYDSGSTPLEEPISCPLPPATLARQHFHRWFSLSRAFLRSAQFSLFRKELRLSAFLLHQSLEHSYTAIHLVFTGYRPTTHNLDKMSRYTSRFSAALAGIFPRHTPEEVHLFQLLKQAYCQGRYAADFPITERECHILLSRSRKLLLMARCLCQGQILSLQKTHQSFTPEPLLP